MNSEKIGIGKVIAYGWESFRGYTGAAMGSSFLFVVAMTFISCGLFILFAMFRRWMASWLAFPAIVLAIGSFFCILCGLTLSGVFVGGMSKLTLAMAKEEDTEGKGLFSVFAEIGKWLNLFFRLSLITIGAVFLCHLGMILASAVWRFGTGELLPNPGIVLVDLTRPLIQGFIYLAVFAFMVRYAFAPFLAADGLEIRDSLERCVQMTVGIRPGLFLTFICLGLLAFFGIIFAGFGILVTLPVAWLSAAHKYRDLQAELDKRISMGLYGSSTAA